MELVEKYIYRLGVRHPQSAGLYTLFQLHRNHVLCIPFENLDIYWGREISLDMTRIAQKILHTNRGGYCYELNGLFQSLLSLLGYNSWLVSARVYSGLTNSYSPEFDHAAIVVDTNDERYLADVGFGDFIYEPLKIEEGLLQTDNQGKVEKQLVLSRTTDDRWIVSKQVDGAFVPQYSFGLQPRILEDFSERNGYNQTSPDSHFTQNTICTMARENGRLTLTPAKSIKTADGIRSEEPIPDNYTFEKYLADYFNIYK